MRSSPPAARVGVIIPTRRDFDALQYLTGLVANRADGDYMRVTIDSGNYREKREKPWKPWRRNWPTMRSKSTELHFGAYEPYERRIIHAAVSQVEGALSTSVGKNPTAG